MNLKIVAFVLSLFAFAPLPAQQPDKVAIIINGKPVYQSEVAEAFAKSNAQLETPETIDQFLPGYINYKLNLLEAEKQRLDTAEMFRREYYNFKVVQAAKYLNDTVPGENFIRETYNLLLEDRKVTHVLLPYEQKEILFPSDTLALYKKALMLRSELIKDNFGDLENDTESSLASMDIESARSYTGWITPFMFSYPVEKSIYALEKGEVSQPIRTARGYHIVRLEDLRPARGQLTIEQVHYMFPQIPATQHQIDSVRHIAEKVYGQIHSSADFDRLCKSFSTAYNTGDRGCEYGTISLDAKLPVNFIEAAYAIQNPGDISKPVMTEIGFHIIRLKEVIPPPGYNKIRIQLFNKIRLSEKFSYYNRLGSQSLNSRYNLSINNNAARELYKLADTTNPRSREFYLKIKENNTPLFTIDSTETYYVKDFADYLDKIYLEEAHEGAMEMTMPIGKAPTNNLSSDMLESDIYLFSTNMTREYARRTIEQKYPEAGIVVKKFRDDMMVFEIKNKNIWQRASLDEAGLARYFKKNKARYTWNSPRYRGLIVHCKTPAVADSVKMIHAEGVRADLLESRIRDAFNADSVNVQIEKGVWEKGENSFADYHIFSGNEPKARPNFPYHVAVGQLLTLPQTYEDDKVRVESDYQLQLGKEWDKYLRKKYKVKVKNNVIENIQ